MQLLSRHDVIEATELVEPLMNRRWLVPRRPPG
jgi:hypothetical protein